MIVLEAVQQYKLAFLSYVYLALDWVLSILVMLILFIGKAWLVKSDRLLVITATSI